jgi:hypothetical protein
MNHQGYNNQQDGYYTPQQQPGPFQQINYGPAAPTYSPQHRSSTPSQGMTNGYTPGSPVHSGYGDYASPQQGNQWSPHARQASLPVAQPLPTPATNGRTPFQQQPMDVQWYQQQEMMRRQTQQPARPASSNSNRSYANATLPPAANAGSPVFAPSPLGAVRTQGTPAPAPLAQPSGTAATFIDSQAFMTKLIQYMHQVGTPLTSIPTLDGRQVDLPRLYQLVQTAGGYQSLHQTRQWEWLCANLGFQGANGQTGHPPQRLQQLQEIYQRYLLPFENFLKSQQQHQRANSVEATNPPPTLSAQLAAQNSMMPSVPTKQASKPMAAASPPNQHVVVKGSSMLIPAIGR